MCGNVPPSHQYSSAIRSDQIRVGEIQQAKGGIGNLSFKFPQAEFRRSCRRCIASVLAYADETFRSVCTSSSN